MNLREAIDEMEREVPTMVTVIDAVDEALRTIKALKKGDCWCEMAVGNPMVTSHGAACERARKLTK